MYNLNLKERFITESNIIDTTARNYRYILGIALKTEKELDKDIYEFTPYECDQLLFSYRSKSVGMVTVVVACLRRYIDFCISNNLVQDYFNYFKTLKGTEDYKKYVSKFASENKFITFEELQEIEGLCENIQDYIILELLFNGVKGEECSELINLKVTDVYPDKIVLLNREIKISDRTYNLIQEAINQKEYAKGNGEPASNVKSAINVINPSEYVLRPSGKNKVGKIGYQALRQRMNRVKDYFDNPYITFNSVWYSGMIHVAKQMKAEKGELTKEDYLEINRLFGYSPDFGWFPTKTRLEPYL